MILNIYSVLLDTITIKNNRVQIDGARWQSRLNFEFLEICIVLICVNKANIYHSKHHLFFILCNNLYILKT